MTQRITLDELNDISYDVVSAAIEVHRLLGPGLLESVYEVCLAKELIQRGHHVKRQVKVPVVYKDQNLDLDFRIDLLVDDEFIVEIKAAEGILPVHIAQVMTYLKLSERKLGLLINFNVKLLKEGIRRVIV